MGRHPVVSGEGIEFEATQVGFAFACTSGICRADFLGPRHVFCRLLRENIRVGDTHLELGYPSLSCAIDGILNVL